MSIVTKTHLTKYPVYKILIYVESHDLLLTPLEFILAKVAQNKMSSLLKCLSLSMSSLNR